MSSISIKTLIEIVPNKIPFPITSFLTMGQKLHINFESSFDRNFSPWPILCLLNIKNEKPVLGQSFRYQNNINIGTDKVAFQTVAASCDPNLFFSANLTASDSSSPTAISSSGVSIP